MNATKLDESSHEVAVDRRLLGLYDEAAMAGPNPPLPAEVRDWVSTSEGKVLMESDEDVLEATLHVQVWDGPAPVEQGWPRTKTVPMELESGKLAVDEIQHGCRELECELPAGSWQVRLCWRTENEEQASVLAQFWPSAPVDA